MRAHPIPVWLLSFTACGDPSAMDDEDVSNTDETGDGDADVGDGDGDGDAGDGDSVSCDYTSPFTSNAECRDYVGSAWTPVEVASDCDGVQGQVEADGCATAGVLGRCALDAGTDWELQIVIYGDDAASCELQAVGCETFGGGVWVPEMICEGSDGGGSGDENVFIQPTKVCVDPLQGEPPGLSDGGQVCTWQAISASTEEGRKFVDYASCDVVRSQRPYYAAPPATPPAQPDPRLDDLEYVAELDWVRSQVEASACVCCHSDVAPVGASNWTIDAPGNWMDSFYDSGLTLGANWIDSVAFGAFPPEDNNGFDRVQSGFPTTDPARMIAFFVAELEHRGRTQEEFADADPFGSPLYDQLIYEPEACANGEGVQPDGTVVWTGGLARYVYVLEAGASNPTVPPNLDLPDGTLWRIDVPWDGGESGDAEPIGSAEVTYGSLPAGMLQRFPVDGAPAALVPGNAYYLYVTRDVAIPVTRCLFTYEN
jgi:hypothetical protein